MCYAVDMDTDPSLSQRLRQARGARRLGDVAKAARVHRVALSRYEHGHVTPGAEALVRLASELGVTAEWLVRGDPEPSTSQHPGRAEDAAA